MGPIIASFQYDSEDGARVLPVYSVPEKTVFYCYYNGGCFFDAADIPKNSFEHEVLATYDNGLPAIITCHVGKGVALLSGVHFECPLLDTVQEASRKKWMAGILQHVFKEIQNH